MRATEPKDAIALAVIALVLAAGLVVTQLGRWLDAVTELARSPLVPVLAGTITSGLVALLLVRHVITRRALRDRTRVVMVPADSFDPDPEAIVRFAASLSRTRRAVRGLLETRASAVRIRLDSDPDGRLRYAIELPAHAAHALRAAAGSYAAVDLRDEELAGTPVARSAVEGREVVRAELVLARPSAEPLRAVGIDPDPLAGFAGALEPLRVEDETAEVCIDLLPLTASSRRRLRRRMLRTARRTERQQVSASFGELLAGGKRSGGRAAPAELVERRSDQRALTGKLGSPEPLFTIQVLVRASGPVRGRVVSQLDSLAAGFDAFAGENHFRVAGIRLLAGLGFAGSDAPWRRRRFDRRIETGLFRPARRGVVTASEIAGLLKPPTVRCTAANVLRSGGVIPAPPRGLRTFTGQRELLPLGRVSSARDGERLVGVPLEGTFFTYMAGRSRYGKTETAIGQFLHLARSGHGCFFLDPHEDALHKIKHHLPDTLRERVVELNFADHGISDQLGWNLFAPNENRSRQQQVDAVVDAFASALRWDEVNARALNLTTQSAQALIDLAAILPAGLAPTIFQIPTLLGNDAWRTLALPHVSPPTRQFFTERFPRLSVEAITPVTNLIDRLRTARSVAAVLGNPASGYDIAAAMNDGRIVLACPGSGSARDRLVANFLVYDLLHAAKLRAATDPARRRPFFVFLDEVQTYDGASSGNLAALLEQTAKYGIRAFLFNQNPERLTPATLNAVTTNRSHLLTTALNARAAALITREWAGTIAPETVTRLQRYTFLASVTLDGTTSEPFLVNGVPADDLPAPNETHRRAGSHGPLAARTPVDETIDQLDRHDKRIEDHLAGLSTAGSSARSGAGMPAGGRTLAAEARGA